jgi:propanol-preferring alcohol dehydrogenase
MAEYMLAPSKSLIPLKRLEPWQAAPLTDAGLTSYHAVKRCLPYLTPDVAVAVIGIGGLGHLALEFLRELSGARVIAVDREEAALKMAEELGAYLCLPSDEHTVAGIRDATDGLGAMVVLDFVGIDQTLSTAREAVRQNGQIVVVGLGGGTLPFQAGALPYGSSVSSIFGGSTAELAEVVALAEAGRIKPKIVRFALDDVIEVYEKLHKNEITGRAVLVP